MALTNVKRTSCKNSRGHLPVAESDEDAEVDNKITEALTHFENLRNQEDEILEEIKKLQAARDYESVPILQIKIAENFTKQETIKRGLPKLIQEKYLWNSKKYLQSIKDALFEKTLSHQNALAEAESALRKAPSETEKRRLKRKKRAIEVKNLREQMEVNAIGLLMSDAVEKYTVPSKIYGDVTKAGYYLAGLEMEIANNKVASKNPIMSEFEASGFLECSEKLPLITENKDNFLVLEKPENFKKHLLNAIHLTSQNGYKLKRIKTFTLARFYSPGRRGYFKPYYNVHLEFTSPGKNTLAVGVSSDVADWDWGDVTVHASNLSFTDTLVVDPRDYYSMDARVAAMIFHWKKRIEEAEKQIDSK